MLMGLVTKNAILLIDSRYLPTRSRHGLQWPLEGESQVETHIDDHAGYDGKVPRWLCAMKGGFWSCV